MRCPQCQLVEYTCVLNTVHREDGVIRRRRGCRACQVRWTTYEDIELGSLINAFVPRPVVGEGLPRPELPVRGALIPDDGHLEFGGKDVLNTEPSLDE